MRAEFFFSIFLFFLFLLVLSAGCGYVLHPQPVDPFSSSQWIAVKMLFALFIILTFFSFLCDA